MFHTKNQIKKVRECHVGVGILIYRSSPNEVCETEFFIDRKTGRPCYTLNGEEVKFELVEEEN